MLRNTKALEGCELRARDGAIGQVKDVYFDDERWHVRYFVVSTGSWLSGREVLISPGALVSANIEGQSIAVDLTKEQVRNSPGVDTDRPVSRQQELELHSYYAWPYYWTAPVMASGYTAPIMPGTTPTATALRPSTGVQNPALGESAAGGPDGPQGDSHLRSARVIRGYHLEATDGSIGHVEDFLVDDVTWALRYMIVDTRNWWPGKKVVVSPGHVERFDWAQRTAVVALTRRAIQEGPEFDPSRPISADYTDRLDAHYQRFRTAARAPGSSARPGSR